MRKSLVWLLGLSLISGGLTSGPSWINYATASDSTTVPTSLLDSILVVIDEQDYQIKMATIRADSCCALVERKPSWNLPRNWWVYAGVLGLGFLGGWIAR